MLLGVGGLAAAYIGFKMASYNDLSRYTVCEGKRFELDSNGVLREYKYTVCPSHLRYCCRGETYEGERCCSGPSHYSYGQPSGMLYGASFGTLLVAVCIGALLYACCCRGRKASAETPRMTSTGDIPSPNPNTVVINGYAPGLDPNVPTYPVSVSKPGDALDPPPPPYLAPPASDVPPPPYPGRASPSTLPYPTAPPPGSGWSNPPSHPPPPYPPQ
ncbi:unnamed protein product [Mesocestoides corti]|nr:unnamed protein product [Mesocestoides corti]